MATHLTGKIYNTSSEVVQKAQGLLHEDGSPERAEDWLLEHGYEPEDIPHVLGKRCDDLETLLASPLDLFEVIMRPHIRDGVFYKVGKYKVYMSPADYNEWLKTYG